MVTVIVIRRGLGADREARVRLFGSMTGEGTAVHGVETDYKPGVKHR